MSRISVFPTHDGNDDVDPRERILTGGMDLRDWFAGQALAGVLGNDEAPPRELVSFEQVVEHYAAISYAYADAMMRERDKF